MNKKLERLLQPGMGLYFVAMLCFCVVTLVMRYYLLAIPQLVAQSLLEMAAFTLFGIGPDRAGLRTLIHILVMTVLFVISFTIQQRWVFAPDKEKNEM